MINAKLDLQSGNMIDLLHPDISHINLKDIARGLAFNPHFGGHVPLFFSIAEHSILVSQLTQSLEGLLHDASEAYLVDMPGPIKQAFPDFVAIENELSKVIFDKFGLEYSLLHKGGFHKMADIVVLFYEFSVFFPKKPNPIILDNPIMFQLFSMLKKKASIKFYDPNTAMTKFIERFDIIKNMRDKEKDVKNY